MSLPEGPTILTSSLRSKQHGLQVTFIPLDELCIEKRIFKLGVKTDTNAYFTITKKPSEFVFFRNSVLDGTVSLLQYFVFLLFISPSIFHHLLTYIFISVSQWMTSAFPSEPIDKEDTRRYIALLKTWLNEFLHDGPSMNHELFVMLHTFFLVEANLGINKSPCSHETINIQARIQPGTGIKKMGYLYKFGGDKSGGKGNWKRRYMVLGDDLLYYENEAAYITNNEPFGKINLNCFLVRQKIGSEETGNPSNEFIIYAVPVDLTCKADTAIEMDSWIETLNSLRFL